MKTVSTSGTDADGVNGRWRFQYRLRSLLLFVLVCSVVCSMSAMLWRARAQEAVIDAIEANGGSAQFTYELDEYGLVFPDPEPPGPRWLRRVLGEHFFTTIVFAEATTDDEVESVAKLTALRHLHLCRGPRGGKHGIIVMSDTGGTSVTSLGLKRICRLTNLETLHLSNASVTDTDLEGLANSLTKLKTLFIHDLGLTDEGYSHLSRFTQLETLNICQSRICGRAIQELASLPKLENLWIDGNRVDEIGLQALGKFGRLRQLGLCGVTSADMRWLGQARKLETLHLRNGDLSALATAGLRQTRGFTQLRSLLLENTRINDADIEQLGGLTQLQRLAVSGTDADVTGVNLGHLATLGQLTELDLGRTKVTDAGLVQISGLRHLSVLGLHGTKITDSVLGCLRSLKDLRRLDLGDTDITDRGLEQLENLGQLRQLDIRGTKATDRGVKRLRLALPGCEVFWNMTEEPMQSDGPPFLEQVLPIFPDKEMENAATPN